MEIAQLACFVLLGYARALRGEEKKKIGLSGVSKCLKDVGLEPRHITFYLIGRFKQEEREQQHFFPVAAVTDSGLRIREWVERATVLAIKIITIHNNRVCTSHNYYNYRTYITISN
jgi:hypothetical protein